jgi:hypothetical protein
VAELQALIDPTAREIITARDIRLTSYATLATEPH